MSLPILRTSSVFTTLNSHCDEIICFSEDLIVGLYNPTIKEWRTLLESYLADSGFVVRRIRLRYDLRADDYKIVRFEPDFRASIFGHKPTRANVYFIV